jgi:glycosyltransferase involved in cell wall biosynthesis
LSKWDYYCAGAISFFSQAGASTSQPDQLKAFERCLRFKTDLLFIHRIASMCPPLLTRKTLPPILFDLDDVEHVRFLRGIEKRWEWPYKLLQYSHLPALLWAGVRAIRLARRTFVCSETDRKYLAGRWKLPGIVTIPNSVMGTKCLPVTSEPTLLFLGTYGYEPNAQAADFLIAKIWPHVLRAIPSARLIIAGRRPEQITAYFRPAPGVEFSGFVDDLESLYSRSRVVCCPILRGGGTRIKIIEAAAYGKPIVATSLGAEGLHMQDGRELLIRDNPDSFARACIDLLKDAALCERLGTTAYQTAISRYNRAAIVQLIQNYISEAAQPQTVGEDKTPRAML